MNAISPHRFSVSARAWQLPNLTVEQKRFCRLENLLLESPQGFYQSHLIQNLACQAQELEGYLAKLGAVQMGDFWVHPIYITTAGRRFSFHEPLSIPANAERTVFDALTADPMTSITRLLALLKSADVRVLKCVLVSAVRPDIDRYFQNLAIKYLFTHFNINKQPYLA